MYNESMETSQNGYTVLDSLDDCRFYPNPSGVKIPLRRGAAGYVLAHFIRRFHNQVENLNRTDCHGYNRRQIAGTDEWSNHASGTAVDLNATKHIYGAEGTFNDQQVRELRELLDKYDGVIKWGGDYRITKDEMHFEIVADRRTVRDLAERLRG